MRHLVIIYNNGCGVIIILLAYMTNETPIVSLFSRIQIWKGKFEGILVVGAM